MMESAANSFRENERTLDNFISEGQMILSRVYEIRLKARSESGISEITRGLMSEGLKQFVGVPKKYTAPFLKKSGSVEKSVDEALRVQFEDWLNRITGFLKQVSVYTPSLKSPNSLGLVKRLLSSSGAFVHIESRTRCVNTFLNSLRNKQLVSNSIVPELARLRKVQTTITEPKRIPLAESVDVHEAIREAIHTLEASFRKYTGRAEQALGHLSELAVKAYYESKGYHIRETTPEIDQRYKTDLVGERPDEVLMIQVKKGQISTREILDVFSRACELLDSIEYQNVGKKTVVVVARGFPENYLTTRDSLRKGKEVDLQLRSIKACV